MDLSIVWMFKNVIATLLLPPANGLLLLLLAGLFRRRRWAFGLAVFAFLLLLAQSLDPVAKLLIEPLERDAGPVITDPREAQAIVVLAGGRDRSAPEYGGDTVSFLTLERLRYGAVLAKRYGLPVLASGGGPGCGCASEADLIADVLEQELGVPVRWREDQSADTADNATMSAEILLQQGISRIVLVTHAFHMPRARRAFASAGLEVVPAPMGYKVKHSALPESPLDWLPQVKSLRLSHWALHEWIGLAWYKLAGAY